MNNKNPDNKTPENDDQPDVTRRQALISAGRFAAYVAPAMTVLTLGDDAQAHHKPWHQTGGSGGDNCRGWAANEGVCSTF